ncbi:hypothetical protein [Cellulomonas iranensis]|uniref:hypothetical protein n=1 Tax=Cellulomonas iranensis TaxID=76862 RepID=UPI0013D004F2|nr:hypothetical protein [Cellulomonas iranensis]
MDAAVMDRPAGWVTEAEERELLDAAGRGDNAALGRLLMAHEDVIRSRTRRARDRAQVKAAVADGDDLYQAAMMALCQAARHGRLASIQGRFGAWATTVVDRALRGVTYEELGGRTAHDLASAVGSAEELLRRQPGRSDAHLAADEVAAEAGLEVDSVRAVWAQRDGAVEAGRPAGDWRTDDLSDAEAKAVRAVLAGEEVDGLDSADLSPAAVGLLTQRLAAYDAAKAAAKAARPRAGRGAHRQTLLDWLTDTTVPADEQEGRRVVLEEMLEGNRVADLVAMETPWNATTCRLPVHCGRCGAVALRTPFELTVKRARCTPCSRARMRRRADLGRGLQRVTAAERRARRLGDLDVPDEVLVGLAGWVPAGSASLGDVVEYLDWEGPRGGVAGLAVYDVQVPYGQLDPRRPMVSVDGREVWPAWRCYTHDPATARVEPLPVVLVRYREHRTTCPACAEALATA